MGEALRVAATYRGGTTAADIAAKVGGGSYVAALGQKASEDAVRELAAALALRGLSVDRVAAPDGIAEKAWLDAHGRGVLLRVEGAGSSADADPEAFEEVVQAFLTVAVSSILANPGAGKTYCTRVLLERAHARGYPCVIFDPKGDHYGVKLGPDGQSEGLPFTVLGGRYGDVDLPAHSGKAIGEYVAARGPALVLDTSLLDPTERLIFAADFYEALFAANDAALLSVIDEAHTIVPQRRTPVSERAVRAVQTCASMGRQRGLHTVLISQRTQDVEKSVLDLSMTMAVMNLIAPAARKRVKEWFEGSAEPGLWASMSPKLASLPVGEAFVYSPRLMGTRHVKVPLIQTYDSMREPEPGEVRRVARRVGSPEEVSALLSALSPPQDDEDAKASPKGKGGGNGAARPAAQGPVKKGGGPAREVSVRPMPALPYPDLRDALKAAEARVGDIEAKLSELSAELERVRGLREADLVAARAEGAAALREAVEAALAGEIVPGRSGGEAELVPVPEADREAATEPSAGWPDGLSDAAAAVLGMLGPLDPPRVTKAQADRLLEGLGDAGREGLASLRVDGLVQVEDGVIVVADRVATRERAVFGALREALSGSERRVLDAVLARPGSSAKEIAQAIKRKASGGSWKAIWGDLRRLDLAWLSDGSVCLGETTKAHLAAAASNSGAGEPGEPARPKADGAASAALRDPRAPLTERLAAVVRDAGPVRLTWQEAGAVIGKRPVGGSFALAKRRLLDFGDVEEDREGRLTAASPLPSAAPGLADALRSHLSPLARAILDEVVGAEGAVGEGTLAVAANHSGKGPLWDDAVGSVVKTGFVDRTDDGLVATPELRELWDA